MSWRARSVTFVRDTTLVCRCRAKSDQCADYANSIMNRLTANHYRPSISERELRCIEPTLVDRARTEVRSTTCAR